MKTTTALFAALVALNVVLLGLIATNKSETVREVVTKELGAVASPDLQSAYFSYGGVRHWAAKNTALTDASTTVCALLSPAATSTLQFGSIKYTTGATTTQTLSAGKGTTRYTIDRLFATSSAAADEKATLLAATTTPAADQTAGKLILTDRVFSPSTYLVFTISSANSYTDVEGTCEATWYEN